MPTLEENVNRVKAAKTAIGAAITAKGGTVNQGDGLEEFDNDISTIPTYKQEFIDTIQRTLTEIDIPDGTTTLQTYAFFGCINLVRVSIPSSVTTLGNSVFNYCSKLPSITIPSSVTAIGVNTFQNCTLLTTITINKAQDSITGAPWGAPNATVVWTG